MTKRERLYHSTKWIRKVEKAVVNYHNRLAESIAWGTHYPAKYDCDKMDVFFDEYPKWSEPPKTLQCSKEYMEAIRKLPTAKSFGSETLGIEVRESSIFPYEKKWAACDIETKLEHQIPSGEWVHGVMVAPPREQSIGLMMTETPAYHPYLDKVREEMYGYQYRFMTF